MPISVAKAFPLMVAIFLVFLCDTSVAGKKDFKWDPVTDPDWNVSEDPSQEIVGAVMIFEKIIADDTRYVKRKFYESYYRRIRILSPAGRDEADVQIPYMNKGDKIEEIRGRVILKSGEIIELNTSVLI